MCEDFAKNFSYKITGCYITTTFRLTLPVSTGNFFTKINHPTFLFPRLKIKLKGRHFDRRRFTDCSEHPQRTRRPECILKNGRSGGNGAYARQGSTSRVMVASMPKVSVWPDVSSSPGNYGCYLYCSLASLCWLFERCERFVFQFQKSGMLNTLCCWK
jgi:hypothetical protein